MAQRLALKPPVNDFGTVDPAPASPITNVTQLRAQLLDERRPIFERFQAVFALQNADTGAAALALCAGLAKSGSVLLRHECAYVLGQLQRAAAIPALAKALEGDASPWSATNPPRPSAPWGRTMCCRFSRKPSGTTRPWKSARAARSPWPTWPTCEVPTASSTRFRGFRAPRREAPSSRRPRASRP